MGPEYRQKVNLCRFDPYLLKNSECRDDLRYFPSIQYPDIVNYLVLQTSWETGEEMKAYKALDAYNFFVSGWVNTVFTKKVAESNSVVVTARVYHLQRTRTTPLSTWLLADVSGEVILGHCDCMAGLCEACSHIAALLVAVEAGYRMRDSVTCTGEKGQWIMPSYVKEIPYMPVSDMDLTSANKLRKQLEEPDGSKQRAEKKRPQIEVTTASERDNFFKEIFNYGKSAILSLTPPYNSSFIFHEEQSRCSSATVEEPELIDEVFSALHINAKEADTVESVTRNQNQAKLWYTQRAARITASKFKSTCSSNPENHKRV
ncbi:uncharacterized protein LOC111319046 [Stylophora pistillata]|uniref:uncharacterized protein LOC111319046 n=1 Tax=Stylophora pistillata TaxID=50429 RepID=UPI000C053907|nr:uncharacterized protein LOC111319046 [Stylophora pistillata]